MFKRLELVNLLKQIENRKNEIDLLCNNIYKSYTKKIELASKDFEYLLDKLSLVNPLNIMKKGYTIVYKDEKVITSSKDVFENDELIVNFYDGKHKVKVIK